MVCGLIEIPLAVLAAVAAVATAITALSETLPFLTRFSGNGLIHGLYHIIRPSKCVEEEPTPVAEVAGLVIS